MKSTWTLLSSSFFGIISVCDGPVALKSSFPGPDSVMSTTKLVVTSVMGFLKAGPSTFTFVFGHCVGFCCCGFTICGHNWSLSAVGFIPAGNAVVLMGPVDRGLSLYMTSIVYSPGTLGMKSTLTVPLPISLGLSSTFEGPLIPNPRLPGPDSVISTTK